jgi:hypothetical protein
VVRRYAEKAFQRLADHARHPALAGIDLDLEILV